MKTVMHLAAARGMAAGLALAMSVGTLRAGSTTTPPSTNPPAPPTIASLRTNRANVSVTVKLPKGWQAVVLESREYPSRGAWVPRAIARSGLSSGAIVFTLPLSLKGQQLRVRGELKEALPKSFYAGTHSFA